MVDVVTSTVAAYVADSLTDAMADGETFGGTEVSQILSDLRSLNSALNGATTVTALALAGAVETDAHTNADDLVIGATGGSGANYGMTIQSDDAGDCYIYFADASSTSAGGFQYDHGSTRFRWYVEGAQEMILTSGTLAPSTTLGLDLGGSGNRWSTMYGQTGDFSGNVTVGAGTSGVVLDVDGTGAQSDISLSDAGVNGWIIRYEHTSNDWRLNRRNPSTGANVDNPIIVSSSTGNVILANDLEMTSGGPILTVGSGSPESVVTADVGSIYMRTDGGASTSIYVKESGTGNTGWVAK